MTEAPSTFTLAGYPSWALAQILLREHAQMQSTNTKRLVCIDREAFLEAILESPLTATEAIALLNAANLGLVEKFHSEAAQYHHQDSSQDGKVPC
jgi:hypothetical protein